MTFWVYSLVIGSNPVREACDNKIGWQPNGRHPHSSVEELNTTVMWRREDACYPPRSGFELRMIVLLCETDCAGRVRDVGGADWVILRRV